MSKKLFPFITETSPKIAIFKHICTSNNFKGFNRHLIASTFSYVLCHGLSGTESSWSMAKKADKNLTVKGFATLKLSNKNGSVLTKLLCTFKYLFEYLETVSDVSSELRDLGENAYIFPAVMCHSGMSGYLEYFNANTGRILAALRSDRIPENIVFTDNPEAEKVEFESIEQLKAYVMYKGSFDSQKDKTTTVCAVLKPKAAKKAEAVQRAGSAPGKYVMEDIVLVRESCNIYGECFTVEFKDGSKHIVNEDEAITHSIYNGCSRETSSRLLAVAAMNGEDSEAGSGGTAKKYSSEDVEDVYIADKLSWNVKFKSCGLPVLVDRGEAERLARMSGISTSNAAVRMAVTAANRPRKQKKPSKKVPDGRDEIYCLDEVRNVDRVNNEGTPYCCKVTMNNGYTMLVRQLDSDSDLATLSNTQIACIAIRMRNFRVDPHTFEMFVEGASDKFKVFNRLKSITVRTAFVRYGLKMSPMMPLTNRMVVDYVASNYYELLDIQRQADQEGREFIHV